MYEDESTGKSTQPMSDTSNDFSRHCIMKFSDRDAQRRDITTRDIRLDNETSIKNDWLRTRKTRTTQPDMLIMVALLDVL
jgi:hypothetical protein